MLFWIVWIAQNLENLFEYLYPWTSQNQLRTVGIVETSGVEAQDGRQDIQDPYLAW